MPFHPRLASKRGSIGDLSIGTLIELFIGIGIAWLLVEIVFHVTDLATEDVDQKTLTSFTELTQHITALLQNPSHFTSFSPFTLYLSDNHLIIGFDSDWKTSPVPNPLGNYHFYYTTPTIFTKPAICGTDACLCLYKGNYDQLLAQKNLIHCSAFSNLTLTFSAFYSSTYTPSSSIIGSRRNDVPYEPFITGSSYHFFIYGKPGVANFYLEKYIKPSEPDKIFLFLSSSSELVFNGNLHRVTDRGNYLQFCSDASTAECKGKHYNEILTTSTPPSLCKPSLNTPACTSTPISYCTHGQFIVTPCICQGDSVYTSGYCYNNWHYEHALACDFNSCKDYEEKFGKEWKTYCTRDPCKLSCSIKFTHIPRVGTKESCE